MTDLINRWFQHRLGILIDHHKSFGEATRDGNLLCILLKNYGIIEEDQYNLIEKTNVDMLGEQACLRNFNEYIVRWLARVGVNLTPNDVMDIVQGKESTSIAVFHKLFVKLHDKNGLDVITHQRLHQKLRPESKFSLTEVKEQIDVTCERNKHAIPMESSYDVVHWHRDRFEVLVNKCKAARDAYLVQAKNKMLRMSSVSTSFNPSVVSEIYDEECKEGPHEVVPKLHQSYGDLMEETKKAKQAGFFVPDMTKASDILRKLQAQREKKISNEGIKKQMHHDILSAFWEEVKASDSESFNNDLTDKVMKQSFYEKQMVRKMVDVRQQKDVMIENKEVTNDALAKEREKVFVDRLLDQNKDLNEKEILYYIDRERTVNLHRKLFDEKVRLKEERTKRLCSDVVTDILTLSMAQGDFKNFYGEEPSERLKDEWKKAFITGESIEAKFRPVEDIIRPKGEDEETEEIIHKEIDRQDQIDKKDFQSYQNFEWPWLLENIETDEETLYYMENGERVVGRIVFSLLEMKYPIAAFPAPPNFDKLRVSACVNGLSDTSFLPLLQKMLQHREIIVIEVKDVIDYCLNAYKAEIRTGDDGPDEPEDDQADKKKKERVKERKGRKSKKYVKGKKSKNKDNATTDEEATTVTEKAVKKVQTPRFFPGEEPTLSPQAELGKIVDEVLADGNNVNDYLLVVMFVEYLQSKLDRIKGFALINYPTTYEQAALLEEALTGVPVAVISTELRECKSIAEELQELTELEDEFSKQPYDEFESLRTSRLLNDPYKKPDVPFYDTGLTAYIQVAHAEDISVCEETGELSIFSASLPAVDGDTRKTKLEQFYSDQGCNYSLYYENFDFYTVKHLAKLIIGDYSIPPKSSIELFGDIIKYINADMTGFNAKPASQVLKKGDKKARPKQKAVKEDVGTITGNDKKIDKKGKGKGQKDRVSHAVIVREDKFTQLPEVEIEEVEPSTDDPPKPGEPGWEYLIAKLPSELSYALASLWENLEDVYIGDFQQLLFIKRLLLNAVMPFASYARKHMGEVITAPDNRQDYLRRFQQMYNEFDDDIRVDVEFKAELHCRVQEMKDKLIDLCDKKMLASERERGCLINQRWAPRHLTELLNTYICAFQLELDRFLDTQALIADYYIGVITKVPNPEDTLVKENLPRVESEDQQLYEATCRLLQYVGDSKDNPFTQKADDFLKKALAYISKMERVAMEVYEKTKGLFGPHAAGGKEKDKPKKLNGSKKGGGGEKNMLKLFEPDEKVKRNFGKIFDEWICALRGETARVTLRLKLLRTDFVRSVDEVVSTLQKAFRDIYEDIYKRYRAEVDSVNRACELLCSAIEAGVRIQEELVFKGDDFYADSKYILYTSEVEEEIYEEASDDYIFTIKQLDEVSKIFLDLAPSGWLPLRSFTFILQDMTVSDQQKSVPKMWFNLPVEDIDKLIKELFGTFEMVPWKEFVLYNLMVAFPTEDELLNCRRAFLEFDEEVTGLVTKDNFKEMKLWFEGGEKIERLLMIKDLLFKLYRVDGTWFNYTAMLLDFCKGKNTAEGLGKALTLSFGIKVCSEKEMGDDQATNMILDRAFYEEELARREEERFDNIEYIDGVVKELIDQSVHLCESTIIEEVFDEETQVAEQERQPSIKIVTLEDESNSSVTGKLKMPDGIKKILSSRISDPYKARDEKGVQINPEPDEYVEPKSSDETEPKLTKSNLNEDETQPVDDVRRMSSEQELEVQEMSVPELEVELSGVDVVKECNERRYRYLINVEELKDVLKRVIPDYFKVRKINQEEQNIDEFVQEIYEQCKRPDFNDECFIHDILNNKTFLEHLSITCKFLIRSAPKIVQDYVERNK
ncbi:unnamed protein product [Acanthoscelides obtectus]|uniref:Sperm flagellar protein 2 n=1 Tax=Acanthoscelides obtectus TaxID=200917 RepID=A0A9P0LDZ1_ACAOB|nr:unnamed protein product [Acanthoscelides obtectus]CAK1664168.1 Sperm flagellar protein 2 [Acanthoscelides obtectus]